MSKPAPSPDLRRRLVKTILRIAKLLNTSPVSWDDASDVRDKIILVSESLDPQLELIRLLRDHDQLKRDFGKKNSLGKVLFSWMKYLVATPELESNPSKLDLSVFHDPIYAHTPINIPVLGGTAYLTERPSDDEDDPTPDSEAKGRGDDQEGEHEGVASDADEQQPIEAFDDGEEETRTWDARQVHDSDYRASDDADSDEDSPPAKKRKSADSGKSTAPPATKKRSRVDADIQGQSTKKIKATDSQIPEGAHSPATPCDNCASKSILCWAHKANVACNPCHRKRRQCNLSVRTRNRLNAAQHAKESTPSGDPEARIISTNSMEFEEDRHETFAKPSNKNGTGLLSRATSVASSISVSARPVLPTFSDGPPSISSFSADAKKKSTTDSRSLLKRSAASVPAKTLNEVKSTNPAKPSDPEVSSASTKPARTGKSLASTKNPQSDTATSSKVSQSQQAAKASPSGTSTSSAQNPDRCGHSTWRVSPVHPAAPVELTWSTVERTVSRLILQNAAQQASINQLSATVAVLLEESKAYEKVAADAATHHRRIGDLETQLELVRQDNKALREDAMKWDKAVNTTVDDHGRQLEGIAGILNVVNNWTAYQIKRELGDQPSSGPAPTPTPTPLCSSSETQANNNPSSAPHCSSSNTQPGPVPTAEELTAMMDMYTRAEAFASQGSPGQSSHGGPTVAPFPGQERPNPSGVPAPSTAAQAHSASQAGSSPEGGSPHCFSDSSEDGIGFQQWRYEYDEVEDLLLYVDSDSN